MSSGSGGTASELPLETDEALGRHAVCVLDVADTTPSWDTLLTAAVRQVSKQSQTMLLTPAPLESWPPPLCGDPCDVLRRLRVKASRLQVAATSPVVTNTVGRSTLTTLPRPRHSSIPAHTRSSEHSKRRCDGRDGVAGPAGRVFCAADTKISHISRHPCPSACSPRLQPCTEQSASFEAGYASIGDGRADRVCRDFIGRRRTDGHPVSAATPGDRHSSVACLTSVCDSERLTTDGDNVLLGGQRDLHMMVVSICTDPAISGVLLIQTCSNRVYRFHEPFRIDCSRIRVDLQRSGNSRSSRFPPRPGGPTAVPPPPGHLAASSLPSHVVHLHARIRSSLETGRREMLTGTVSAEIESATSSVNRGPSLAGPVSRALRTVSHRAHSLSRGCRRVE